MSNINPNGSSRFWFDGGAASSIDNGSTSTGAPSTNNWAGNTNYWYRGSPQGFLQGGPGTVAESPQNISMLETTEPPDPPAKSKSRAYAVIL